MTQPITSDDKLMAALAYWGSMLLWFLPALVLYLVKKDTSPFVRKHALQSLALHAVAFAVFGVGFWLVSGFFSVIPLMGPLFAMLLMLVQVLVWLGIFLYFIVLGVQVFQGQDTDIPWVTPYLEKHLGL